MDPSVIAQQTPPTQEIPPPVKKSEQISITWIIIALILIASIITGLAYFFLAKPTKKEQIAVTLTPTPVPQETKKWQKYTNEKYHYSFAYPVTWTLTKASADQKSFELHDQNAADPAIITVNYLTPEERTNLSVFCEQTDDKFRCHRYSITETYEVLVDRLTPTEDTKVDSLITLPEDGTLRVQITDANADSYKTFAIMVDTLKIPNEKRVYGLQICPEIWPTAEKTVPYNGVTIATEDIDATWVKENCK